MKPIVKFLSVLSLSLFVLTGAYGVAPVITGITPDSVELNSPWPAFTPPSPYVPYQITTNTDGTAGAPILYNATGLPAGLTLDALNGEISGAPTELGTFNVILSATNGLDETGTAVLVLTVTDPLPVITSDAAISAAASSPFTYTITATNNPTSFSVIGLGALPTQSVDTTNLSTTGTFTFTPSASAVGDSFNLIVIATNTAGTSLPQLLVVTVLPAVPPAPSVATVALISPVPSDSFTADTTSLTVAATVTPAAGETIDAVFVRWNNPPAKPDGTPRAPIILAQLTNTAGDVYEAVVDIGFDPENREIGGGLIDLEVVAYQANAIDSDDFASDDVQFRVEPLLAVLFPDDSLSRSGFNPFDLFASARINTNDFDQVSARISGPGIVESVTISQASNNGIYNFETTQAINLTGIYQVRVEVLDLSGASTVIERQLFITETVSDPVAVILTPTPGFTNEIFSPAFLSYTQSGAPEPQITVVDGEPITNGYNVTYALTLESGGQGYYPRDGTITLPATADTGVTKSVSDVVISNGRIVSLPASTVIFFSEFFDDDDDPLTPVVPEPRWGLSGTANLDNLQDPGANGKITITAEFFRANAPLESYKIFVNGTDVTPFIGNGFGNLNPDNGDIDLPVFKYPVDGSPDAGDYVVTAQVIDQNGSVANAFPVSFQILPYEPLVILVSRQVAVGDAPDDPIIIGGSATFLAEIEPIDQIESVEFFESLSGDKLSDGSRVQVGGQTLYRSGIVFPEAGNFKVFARGTGFNGQTVISSPVDITVLSGEFPNVEITAPSSGSSVPAGANLEILVAATDPDGQITTVEVFNGNEPLGSATPTGIAGQYRLNLSPSVADAGVLNLIARATDDRGNSTDSDVVTLGVVLGAVPQIEILSPAAGDEFFVDQPFEIRARITDADGTIASATLTDIEFFTRVEGVNGTITIISDSLSFLNDVMSESSTPDEFVFIATINSPDVVGLVITARDNSGNETQSAPLQFTVTNGIVPDVAITAPLAGDSFTRGDIVTIDITSSDADGSVAQVEVFNGTASLGLANFVSTGNYRLNYAANAVGIVNLSARSTDNLGNVGISNIETISIVSGDLPTVTIDSPADGASYTQGDLVTLEITANDDDGFVTSVEIFNGDVLLGTALKISGDQYRYTINTATAEIASGTLNLSARATDNIGNSGSALLTVDLSPIVFSVSFTDPTENPLVLRSTISPIEQVFSVEIAAANAAAIESVQWYFADVLVAESAIVADTLSYTETLNLAKSGELRVKVTDAVSGISVEATVNVIVSINIETPLNSDEAFVRDAYVRLTANTPTDTYVANAVAQMDGTVDGQVAYLQSLFDSSDMVETEQLLMVYRTMTGEWPDATELAAARTGLFGGTVATAAAPGSIETGVPQQTFEFFYNAGDAVTVSVTGAGDDPLSDPTLTINSPSGVLINFDDDSGLGLNPLVNFTATEAGTYSAIVGGFSTLRGDFTISSSATNLGGSTSASLQALVISLIPEFEARFNLTFPTSSVASSTETTNLVLQLFKNKHGVNPSAQATVRLKESLTGPGSGPWPGYSGNLTTFTEAFVLDNSRSHINQGYSSVHYYEIPNQPFGDVPLALMIAMFLDEDPSNQALAAYDGMAQVFESILTDPSYYEQFPPTGVENFVNSALADLGVFDQSFNGPADDADGDGVSNLMEIALGSAPTDLSDTIEPMESATDGTDLVITFIRIKASEVPRDFIISLECSEDLIVWNTAADTAAVASPVADQSGVAEGYERAEIRIDMIAQACGFFRLSVDLP
jgi:hypothetical protein